MRIVNATTLVFLSGWLVAGSLPAQEIFQRDDGTFVTQDLSARAQATPANRLIIRSAEHLTGTITIGTHEQDEVTLEYSKQAKTDTRSKAIDYIDLISVSLERLPEYVRLDLRIPNPPPWDAQVESGSLEVNLNVPVDCHIEIEAVYFDVIARGPIRGLIIPTSLGRMDITDVTEQLELSTANRRVRLERISGRISVTTSNSSILARELVSEQEEAKFRNNGGDITIEGFRGPINIRNRYGRISVTDFQPRGEGGFIRGSSGAIILEIGDMPSGQLVIKNHHDDVEITIPDTLQAFFSLAVGDEGLIEVTNFPFTPDLVQRDRVNLISGDGAAEISSSIRGRGSIYIRGLKGD